MNYLVNICRLCIKEQTTLINIHTTEVGEMKLSGVLSILIPEIDFEEDDLPNSICVNCITKMKDAFEFKQMCIKSNTLLQTHKAQRNKEQESFYYALTGKNVGHNLKNYVLPFVDETNIQPEVSVFMEASEDEVMAYEGPSEDGNILTEARTEIKDTAPPKPDKQTDRPFACDKCNKSFRHQVDYKKHVRVHSEHRPFACDVCGKCFAQRNFLMNHLRSHKGVANFFCDVCGEKYARQCELNEHAKIHESKHFKCEKCAQQFLRKSGLKIHECGGTANKPSF